MDVGHGLPSFIASAWKRRSTRKEAPRLPRQGRLPSPKPLEFLSWLILLGLYSDADQVSRSSALRRELPPGKRPTKASVRSGACPHAIKSTPSTNSSTAIQRD